MAMICLHFSLYLWNSRAGGRSFWGIIFI